MSKHGLFRYETKYQPLLTHRDFAKRVVRSFSVASVLVGVSLLGGMIGYRYLEGMSWIDSFSNAAMILSGMGP